MSLRSIIYPPVARYVYTNHKRASKDIVASQRWQLKKLLDKAKETETGRKYGFNDIKTYAQYKERVPIHHYAHIKSQVERLSKGESDLLWPGKPLYFSVTSGTQSGKKFIPITRESLKSQKMGRLTTMAHYTMKYGRLNALKGPMLFFSARPNTIEFGNYKAQLLSSLMAETIPEWMKKYNLPSKEINKIEDFEARIDFMVTEAVAKRKELRGIVAFPPWLQIFLNKLEEVTDQSFLEFFPKFSLLSTSGMAYTPYASIVEQKMGKHFDRLETYPCSEGFISFTETLEYPGMSMMPKNGLYYEFIEARFLDKDPSQRICLNDIEVNKEYALLVTSNAGLWSYVVGDTVKFVSKDPWRLVVTGRLGQTISLVSEHVSVAETDECVSATCKKHGLTLLEYVCSGTISKQNHKPHYEWLIESNIKPENFELFVDDLHAKLKDLNVLYEEYCEDGIMQKPKVFFVPSGSFLRYLSNSRPLNVQHKINHICKDFTLFEEYKHHLLFDNTQISKNEK
ncbi:GH3 family domain-containing protein [Portibacter marinus]|uniref:GH3 family domain-containing protein n=1 Tax=Portibacter marinus TaxID=2898660 RepID=UPI001F1D3AD1|nr:GH3 auxin-responsive promoter family protein [Portibacter marinus]